MEEWRESGQVPRPTSERSVGRDVMIAKRVSSEGIERPRSRYARFGRE